MEKAFIPAEHEQSIYASWETAGLFEAQADSKKEPFCIVLPPPNANGKLHVGHAMYVYEDILIRFNKMKGKETLWVAGADHAGFETQFVFEKYLQKQGKSRFDYTREELYQAIWDFVMENKGSMEDQCRRLGFALDWSKKKFTLDPEIVKVVYKTFKQLFDEGLVYRSERLVNYCTKCGTSFSDLEVSDKEIEGLLYYVNFPLEEGGFITVATTRPETILGDAAIMVHPKDKRFKQLIGKMALVPLSNRKIPVIGDEYVDMKFGTGAVKVTPFHDFNDFEVAKRHNLSQPAILGFDGKLKNTGFIDGLRVKAGREQMVKLLEEAGLLVKTVPHKMVLKVCYKCGTTLEPLPLEQWYVKVRPLADAAIARVESGEVTIYPKRFKKILLMWLKNFHDWNISRQIVWGIRIPAYYCQSQHQWFASEETPTSCTICGKQDYRQDEDTFDTWFSSAQWPFATLQTMDKDQSHFNYFYPTSVMETGWDILPWWVARMLFIGNYATGSVPFQTIFLHGMVRDKHGLKMSKSKGNVINPIEMVDVYGADALRAALVFGVKEGNDASLSEEKIKGMRNFANKIWNIGRFLEMNSAVIATTEELSKEQQAIIKELEKELKELKKKYLKYMATYRFSKAIEELHQFVWHRFADYYVEQLKEPLKNGNITVLDTLKKGYFESLKMLHPFIPFVTEAVWRVFQGKDKTLLSETL
ncbi:valine--tRNA ligase [Candidatus Roizmanbacteria bacterium]|nr:valine--tRNA ligase [Candidatus Roizmanbacteria bacterium]